MVHLRISGRVQGVWYRGWAVETATALGLDGWVRNRRDGTVEAVAAGDAAQVEAFIKACRDGPPAARVDDVKVAEADPPDRGFRQLPTA
jgi:acylphosphatase